jgi:hypothetical protein
MEPQQLLQLPVIDRFNPVALLARHRISRDQRVDQ